MSLGKISTYARLVIALSFAVAVITYAPIARAGIVYDDGVLPPFVAANPNLPATDLTTWAFWTGLPRHGRMITSVSYQIDHALAPAPHGIGRWHLTSLAIHLINGAILACLAWRALGPVAAVVSAWVFLLHPIQSETVSYLSARADLLIATGVLVALSGLSVVSRAAKWPLVALGCLLASGAKEWGLVGVALIGWTWLVGGGSRRVQWSWWTLGITGGVVCLVLVTFGPRLLANIDRAWGLVQTGGVTGSWAYDALRMHAYVWEQARLIILPVGLTIDHGGPVLVGSLLLLPVLASITVGVVAWYRRCSTPSLFWLVGWIAIWHLPRVLAPMPAEYYLTEHHWYVPMIAVALVAGWVVQSWSETWLSR